MVTLGGGTGTPWGDDGHGALGDAVGPAWAGGSVPVPSPPQAGCGPPCDLPEAVAVPDPGVNFNDWQRMDVSGEMG